MKARGTWVTVIIALALSFGAAAALLLFKRTRRDEPPAAAALEPAPATVGEEELDPWKRAALRLEEDRGEAVGRQASVEVPPQLRHYSDERRFLSIQVAEAREQKLAAPADFAELAELILEGELTELRPLGDDYILYGVGFNADDGPLTHYDGKTGQSVTLFADSSALGEEFKRLDESLDGFEKELAAFREELKGLARDKRQERAALQAKIVEVEKAAAAASKRSKLLAASYGTPKNRSRLFAEHEKLSAFAADFSGHSYDLGDAASRKEFKVRMLSFLRPAAVGVLSEVARSYRQKFDRHLPVTSVVRTEEYQRQLSRVNPNATTIETPPHVTGLAFDIFYRYMTAEEQNYLMGELARLREEGRVEALRERRDHIHVFAFVEGKRPDERSIRQSRDEAAGKKAREETPAKKTRDEAARKKTREKASEKKPQRARSKAAPKPKLKSRSR